MHSHEDDGDFVHDFESECKIEFIDPKYLASNTLDSDNAALDYFYHSPFYLKYRKNALNELIRAGQPVDSCQTGLMFQVTYSNLKELEESATKMFQANAAGRSQFYAMAGIFHITLFSRELGQAGVHVTPIEVYYIMQGSIFMCPPFGPLIRRQLHESIANFEKFYDTINDISVWSIANGYSWEPKPGKVDPRIEALCQRYNFKETNEAKFNKEGNAHIFYMKPSDPLVARVTSGEIKRLSKAIGSLQEESMENHNAH